MLEFDIAIAIAAIGTIIGLSFVVWSTIDIRRKHGKRKSSVSD